MGWIVFCHLAHSQDGPTSWSGFQWPNHCGGAEDDRKRNAYKLRWTCPGCRRSGPLWIAGTQLGCQNATSLRDEEMGYRVRVRYSGSCVVIFLKFQVISITNFQMTGNVIWAFGFGSEVWMTSMCWLQYVSSWGIDFLGWWNTFRLHGFHSSIFIRCHYKLWTDSPFWGFSTTQTLDQWISNSWLGTTCL